MHDPDDNQLADGAPTTKVADMQKTKTQYLKANWKKAAMTLIALDLCVATGIAVFGGSTHVQNMVFGLFR